MKKVQIKNLGLKALALGFSILLWIIVINIEDPVMQQVYTGVPVSIVHPEIITNRGNTYRISDDTKNVTVVVKAKRSVLSNIKEEDINATADMMSLDTKSGVLIPVEVSIPSYAGDYVDAKATPNNIKVSIERGKTERFPITAASSGSVRDGYVLGKLEADPAKVEISGPESIIDSIDKVVAEVNVSGMSRDEEIPAEMVLYDAAGRIIDATLVTFNNLGEEGLTVKVQVLNVKSVHVELDTSEITAASGYKISEIAVQPETVEIVGTSEQLRKINKIEIPASATRLSELRESVDETIDLIPYLPDGVKPVDENAGLSVLVKVSVTRSGTRKIEFPVSSISVINMQKTFKVVYRTTGSINIVLKGNNQSLLENLELEQGSVFINLLNYKDVGNYKIPVQVTLPNGIELEDDLEIEISLEKISGGNDD